MNALRAACCVLRESGKVLALLLVPAVVLAHAYLERSSPKAGEKLAVAPKQLVLIFSKPVELAVTSIQLWTLDSIEIPTLSAPRAHPMERAGIVVDLPALLPREYRVRWRTTSADGHPIQGTFRFTVLGSPAVDASAARVEEAAHMEEMDSTEHMMMHDDDPDAVREGLGGISIPGTIVRWLSFLALFAATGAAAFLWLVLPRLRASALVEPATTVAIGQGVRLTGTAAAFAMAVLVLPRLWAGAAGVVATGSSAMITYATHTASGRALLGQLIAAVIAAIGFTTLPRGRRGGEVLTVVGAVAAIVATSYEGHAAAADSGLIALLTIVHVLASTVWFGMLLIVATVAIPRMLRSSTVRPVPAVAALISIFSPIALICGIAAASIGAVLGFLHVGSFAALVRSDYGRTLMVKVVIVGLVFGTGLYNWKRMKPALSDPAGADRLVRSATVELVLGALVLAATAILVALPSPASLAP